MPRYTKDELLRAIKNKKLLLIDAILSERPDLITQDLERGKNALHLASETGISQIINLVFSKYPDDKAALAASIDNEGNTPLHYAAKYGTIEAIKSYQKHIAPSNLKKLAAQENTAHQTPLHQAVAHRSSAIVKYLLSLYSEAEAIELILAIRAGNTTLLHTAGANATEANLELLLSYLYDKTEDIRSEKTEARSTSTKPADTEHKTVAGKKPSSVTSQNRVNESLVPDIARAFTIQDSSNGNTLIHTIVRYNNELAARAVIYLARQCEITDIQSATHSDITTSDTSTISVEEKMLTTENKDNEYPLHTAIRYRDKKILFIRLIPDDYKGPTVDSKTKLSNFLSHTPNTILSDHDTNLPQNDGAIHLNISIELSDGSVAESSALIILKYCIEKDSPDAVIALANFLGDPEELLTRALTEKTSTNLVSLASTQSPETLAAVLKLIGTETAITQIKSRHHGHNKHDLLVYCYDNLSNQNKHGYIYSNLLLMLNTLNKDAKNNGIAALHYVCRYLSYVDILKSLQQIGAEKLNQLLHEHSNTQTRIAGNWLQRGINNYLSNNKHLTNEQIKQLQEIIDLCSPQTALLSSSSRNTSELQVLGNNPKSQLQLQLTELLAPYVTHTTPMKPVNENGFDHAHANPTSALRINDMYRYGQRIGIDFSKTSLHAYIAQRQYAIVELMLKTDPTLACRSGNQRANALHIACYAGDEEMIRLICNYTDKMPDGHKLYSDLDSKGAQPIHYAATWASIELLEKLCGPQQTLAEACNTPKYTETATGRVLAFQLVHNRQIQDRSDILTPQALSFETYTGNTPIRECVYAANTFTAYFQRITHESDCFAKLNALAKINLLIAVLYSLTDQAVVITVINTFETYKTLDVLTMIGSDGVNIFHAATGRSLEINQALTQKLSAEQKQRLIMQYESPPSPSKKDKGTPLHYAVKYKKPKVFGFYLGDDSAAAYKHCQQRTSASQNTALHILCLHPNISLLRTMYHRLGSTYFRALVKCENRMGITALHYALEFGSAKFIKEFLYFCDGKLVTELNNAYLNTDITIRYGQTKATIFDKVVDFAVTPVPRAANVPFADTRESSLSNYPSFNGLLNKRREPSSFTQTDYANLCEQLHLIQDIHSQLTKPRSFFTGSMSNTVNENLLQHWQGILKSLFDLITPMRLIHQDQLNDVIKTNIDKLKDYATGNLARSHGIGITTSLETTRELDTSGGTQVNSTQEFLIFSTQIQTLCDLPAKQLYYGLNNYYEYLYQQATTSSGIEAELAQRLLKFCNFTLPHQAAAHTKQEAPTPP